MLKGAGGSLMTMPDVSVIQNWADQKRYKDDNEKLLADSSQRKEIRAVFMGNSITDFWINQSPEFFKDNDFVNRGINRQTSPQMLLRFRQDVIALHPKAVVIECGTNDIAGNTGPSTLEMIGDNITSMAELAKANKIIVILGSVLPANKFLWRPEVEPADKIIALNDWIKDYAIKHQFGYINYYDAMVDDQKGLKNEYSEDGVHPNKEGYEVMEKVAAPVIRKVVGGKLVIQQYIPMDSTFPLIGSL
jgi:lysophospholipase L1-like esterase